MVKSLGKAVDLYIFLLAFPAEFRFYLEKEYEVQSTKHFPDKNILAPLRVLLDNKAMHTVVHDESLNSAIKSLKITWNNSSDLYKHIFSLIRESDLLREYEAKGEHTFANDRKLLSEIYELIIGESELLDQYIEERFMNWEDDQVIVTLALLKALHSLKENRENDLVKKSDLAKSEDIEFMQQLFHKTIDEDDYLRELIADKTKNWEADRIAFVDMLLMKMALCEILFFTFIPVKVSINEYLELAKLYSTPNSHGFINGVLDKIQLDLKRDNKIEKQGRGLVE